LEQIVTLGIPDPHLPYHHPDIFKFLAEVKRKFRPTQVFFTGDEVDNAAISFHDKNPDMPYTAGAELDTSIIYMDNFYKLFPDAKVCHSNHGSLVARKGKWAGLSKKVFREWNEILEAPKGWSWHKTIILDIGGGKKLMVKHGTKSPKNALLTAQRLGCCYAQGHHHTEAHIKHYATDTMEIWGCTIGCLIDHTNPAFDYQEEGIPRPCLNVLIIIDGVPYLIPMRLDENRKWIGRL
jgi:hypothetical protein